MLLHVVPRMQSVACWVPNSAAGGSHCAAQARIRPSTGGGALRHVTQASCNCSPKVGGVNGLRARADGLRAVRRDLVVAVVCLAVAMLCALPLRCTRRVGSSHLYNDGL